MEVALWETQQGEERRQTGMALKGDPQSAKPAILLPAVMRDRTFGSSALRHANAKHPHRLPLFFYFIDNPINVRLLTVKQMPQFSL